MQTALKLSQEDQNTIASLKREIEKAWKMVDAAHEKEGRAKETIQQLKHEIQNLSRLVEQGAGLSIGQENTVNELMKVKQELAKERDAQARRSTCSRPRPPTSKVARSRGRDAAARRRRLAALREDDRRQARGGGEGGGEEGAGGEGAQEPAAVLDARQNEIREKQAEHARNVEGAARSEIGLREERGRTDKAGKDNDTARSEVAEGARELDDLALGCASSSPRGAARGRAEAAARRAERRKADGAKVNADGGGVREN